jgi:hypothetical protein
VSDPILRIVHEHHIYFPGPLVVQHYFPVRLASPGGLSVFYESSDNMRNGYYARAEVCDPNTTRRILTVDVGSGVAELVFTPGELLKFVVPQDATVFLTLHDMSINPRYSESETVQAEFVADHRPEEEVIQLASPGKLTVVYTGEEE